MYEEETGVMAKYCKDKERARKVMQEEVDDYLEGIVIDIDLIREDTAFGHVKCGGFSIGEPTCWECGEPTSIIGRTVFVYDINN